MRGEKERSYSLSGFRQWAHLFSILLLCLLPYLCNTPAFAEELEPRRWAHLPVDTNFFGAAYAYTDADISFDPVLKIEDGRASIHTWAAKYIRTFSLFGKTSRLDFLQAFQNGRWTGRLDGVPETVTRRGWADTIVRFAVNLVGAPPLDKKAYAAYRKTVDHETIIGAGVSVQLPTGEYMDDKLINLGTNRYTFRPQVGLVHSWGKWSTEVTGMVALYSDNDDFLSGKKLAQDPLYILHGHIIYTFRPGIWASASAGYDYGGVSTVDGERKDDRKQNVGWALSCGLPLSRNLGVKLSYIGVRTQEPTGADSDTFTFGLSGFF